MRRRSRAGGQPAKTRTQKTVRRGQAPKNVRRRSASVGHETIVGQLTRERDEALEQQAATSEILHVISNSPTNVQIVFNAIARSAAQLCEAFDVVVYSVDGNILRLVAHHGPMPAGDVPLHRGTVGGRTIIEGRLIHTRDLQAEVEEFPEGSAIARERGHRTNLSVPLLKGDAAIGNIQLRRQEVRPFSDKQISLLKTFAAQAVIAIENARLLNELRESLDRQTATSEVLKVISTSPGDLQPVFSTILESAARLCDASFGNFYRRDDDTLHLVATYNTPVAFAEARSRLPLRLNQNNPIADMLAAKTVLHVDDLARDERYTNQRDPAIAAGVELAGVRTFVAVPMLKDNEPIGALVVYRQEVRPFTDKQIALVQNFAAQAVIAIENTRLLNELRYALERQTATSEVLTVISKTPDDPQPVFQTILENATHLCAAKFGDIFRFDGSAFYFAARVNTPPKLADFQRHRGPFLPFEGGGMDRMMRTKQVIQVADNAAEPVPTPAAKLGGARSTIWVPMLKDNELVGGITIYRQEVQPFAEKEIALVQNFAAQAVIAIENARLLNELRQRTTDLSESLEQQTATSEVLEVISSSPGELKPVFVTILENATRICAAKFGILLLFDGTLFRVSAEVGTPADYSEFLRQRGPFQARSGSLVDRVRLTKQVCRTADDAADAVPGSPARLAGARSRVAVPMLKDNELIGVISIYRQEIRPFTDKQIALVQNFAAQAVIAIENARLLNELRESLQQQTATADVLKVINRSTFDLTMVLEALVNSAARLCRAEKANIALLRDDIVDYVAQVGFPPDFLKYMQSLRLKVQRGSISGRAVLEGKIIHVPDVLADPEYVLLDAQKVGGFRTALGVPMMREGTPIGTMFLSRATVEPFTQQQIELVTTFADQAVIAIENMRLLNELRHRTDELGRTVGELQALGEVSQAVNSTLDLQTVLSTIVAKAAQLSATETGAIYGYDEQSREFRLRATYGMDQELIEALTQRHIDLEDPNIAEVFAQCEPLQVADLREEADSELNKIALRAGYRARMVAPLLRGENIVGMLVVRRRTPGEFAKNTVDIIKTFAAQSALAIQNARLFHEIAEKSQQLEEASQHKSQFLANMSHELRTPLNAILGYTELMADGAYGEPSEKMFGVLKRLEANGRHLLGLINDVLDLSKIEAGQLVARTLRLFRSGHRADRSQHA